MKTSWLVLWTLLLAVACSDESPSKPRGADPVAYVQVQPNAAEIVVGETRELRAIPHASDGTPLSGRAVAWNSGAPHVATVDALGILEAKSAGTATIQATVEGRIGTSTVRVREIAPPPPPPVARLEPTVGSEISMVAGQTAQLGVRVLAEDGEELFDRLVTWTAENPSIATVDGSGRLDALRIGRTSVTAAADGVEADIEVEVRTAVVRVDLDPTLATLVVGEGIRLRATPRSATGSPLGRTVTWSSGDESVAVVDAEGNVLATGGGRTTIRASVDGVEGSAEVQASEWAVRTLQTVNGGDLPATLFTRMELDPQQTPRTARYEARSGDLRLAETALHAGRFELRFDVAVYRDGLVPEWGAYTWGGTWTRDLLTGVLTLRTWAGEFLIATPHAGGMVVDGRPEAGLPRLRLAYGGAS